MVDFTPYLRLIIPAAIVFVILAIGGGIGYYFWFGTRTPKLTWKARVWQEAEGEVIDRVSNKDGETIEFDPLSDLRPYTTDTIVKSIKKDGATVHWLTKLQKPVPAVTADCVDVWSQKEKEVDVLFKEDSTTLLKKAYDKKRGKMIFRPLNADRVNMMKTELSERNERLENTKDILAQITPFITVGISILGIVVIAYFIGQAAVKSAEYNLQSTEINVNGQQQIAQLYIRAIKGDDFLPDKDIKKEEPPEIPP